MLANLTEKYGEHPSLTIAIPTYKNRFDTEEQYLVDRVFKHFSNRDILFFGPESQEKNYYKYRYPTAKFINFPDLYFESVQGYSRLLLTKEFYETFGDMEFLLICQPDVYVFRDELDAWLTKPYDYVGAPWPNGFSINLNMGRFKQNNGSMPLTTFVGNGGFSLRRIKKCISLLDQEPEIAAWFFEGGSNEDLFFSFMGAMSVEFIIPNLVEASTFAMEAGAEILFKINNNKLPMAVHAFRKYSPDFWQAYIDPTLF